MESLIEWGYVGLFIGSFLASSIVPFSADVLISGMLLAGGDVMTCFLCATIGNWLGGLTTYGIGWIGRWEWIERWFKVTRERLEKQQEKVQRFGSLLSFLTWLPIVGDIFAMALGFYRCKPIQCSIFMLIGRAARFYLWIMIWG